MMRRTIGISLCADAMCTAPGLRAVRWACASPPGLRDAFMRAPGLDGVEDLIEPQAAHLARDVSAIPPGAPDDLAGALAGATHVPSSARARMAAAFLRISSPKSVSTRLPT